MKMNLYAELIFLRMVSYEDSFYTEAKGNRKWPIGLFRKYRARLCLARA